MSLIQRILRMNQLAQGRLEAIARKELAQSIQVQLEAPVFKSPVSHYGVLFNEEGCETAYSESETFDLGLSLPATQVAWDLLPGRYRVHVRTRAAGTLSAYELDGSPLFENKRISDYAVLDLTAGAVRLVSSSPMEEVSVARFTERSTGEIIIGPFTSTDGIVSVTPVGYGTWEASLAHDSLIQGVMMEGLFLPANVQSPELLDDQLERFVYNAATGMLDLEERTGGIPWSIASRHLSQPPVLDWRSDLPCGIVARPADGADVIYTETTFLDASSTLVWAGLNEWRRLSEMETPAMRNSVGQWAYVWGTIEGVAPAVVSTVYELVTGRKIPSATAASTPGFYLVEVLTETGTVAPEDVVITGTSAAYGNPMLFSDDPRLALEPGTPALHRLTGMQAAVAAGSYRMLPCDAWRRPFLIRLRGKGILRAVDITVRSNTASPLGTAVTTSFRESLSSYWTPGTAPLQSTGSPSGFGLYLPT